MPEITKQYARAVLQAYADGRATKERAVEVLGLRDYAELLVWLGDAGIQPPRLPDAEIEEQAETFAQIWRMG
ncbi:hypothetical protein [Microvirga yunnanensis]|uniref:hypothetical protein n=1 Tax=Microvirga yunnanensis TaxID=2953740 RepID=UPI0021C72766|nr:hypothetical protein [Microvirga sp. HBU67655]